MKRETYLLIGEITVPAGLATSKAKDKDGDQEYQALPKMNRYVPRNDAKYIIPAENLGGGLRRALMDDISGEIHRQGRGRPYRDLFGFFQMRVGGVAGFSTGNKGPDEELALRRKNPFISLFGKAGMGGRLGIGHAVMNGGPANIGRVHGYRSDDFSRDDRIAEMEMVSPEMLDEYKAYWLGTKSKEFADKAKLFFTGNEDAESHGLLRKELLGRYERYTEDADADSTKPDGNDETVSASAGSASQGNGGETNGASADKADKEGTFISIQNPFGGFEYFIPGTKFAHRIMFSGVTEAEAILGVGMFYAFAKQPRLGGHWRSGMGWTDMSYRAYRVSEDPLIGREFVGEIKVRSFLDNDDGGEDGLPAIEATGVMKDLLGKYVRLRSQGFPDMDFAAGAEKDRASVIKSQGRKGKVAPKKKTAGSKKMPDTKDQSSGAEE